MVPSGMLRRVALVRTDVSEELSASFIRMTRIGELGTTLGVTSNRRTLRGNIKVTAVKTSNLTCYHIPQERTPHSHSQGNPGLTVSQHFTLSRNKILSRTHTRVKIRHSYRCLDPSSPPRPLPPLLYINFPVTTRTVSL
jgi:hypothetical protein